jgi:hypothetical protein
MYSSYKYESTLLRGTPLLDIVIESTKTMIAPN